MNESIESLERELASLQPQKPSVELRGRVAQELDAVEYTNRPSSAAMWSVAITVAALAACLFVAILPRDRNSAPPSLPNAPVAAAPDVSESLPTFWTYHRAVTTPSASLDRLLDQHVGKTAATDDSLLHVRAFRSSQNQSAWGGL